MTLERIVSKHTLGVETAKKLAQEQEIGYNVDVLGAGVAFVLDGNFTTKKGGFNYSRYPSQTRYKTGVRISIESEGRLKTYEQKIDFWETCWLLAQEVKGSDGKFDKNLKGRVVPVTQGLGQIGRTDSRWRTDGNEDGKEYPMY